jgi:hypothetical protein
MIEMSVMRGTELLSAAKQRVLEDARVFEMGDDLGIELGHFFARNDEGDAKLACQYYDRVELVFVESGVTNSGVTPKMVVDGECSFDTQQVSRIKPLAIPVKRLMESETPTNMSYDYLAKTPVKLTFKDFGLSQTWPTEWDLVSVRFYVEQMGGRELLITSEDINSIRTSPFTMEWKNTNKRAVSSSH